jgi:hypothetical protein
MRTEIPEWIGAKTMHTEHSNSEHMGEFLRLPLAPITLVWRDSAGSVPL